MKKFLALLLILVLAFGCIGCGNNNDTPEGDDTVIEQGGEGTEEGESGAEGEADSESGESGDASGEGNTINPEDYYISEDYSEMEAPYDYDFKVSDSFGLSSVVEKMSYSDISALVPDLETRLKAAGEKSLGTSFSVFGDYEADDEDEIDHLSYAIGMENDDTEGIYLEGGAYHTKAGKNYQYVTYISRNKYEASDANTAEILKELEAAMGVTISEKKLDKAIDQAFGKAQDTKDYFSLYDSTSSKGKGYSETIKVSVDAFATEDNVIGYYVSCERERCYE